MPAIPDPAHTSRATSAQPPSIAPVRVSCPHCGQPIDVVPVVTTAVPAAPAPSQTLLSPVLQAARGALTALGHQVAPTWMRSPSPNPSEQETGQSTPRSRGLTLLLVVMLVLVGGALIWWGRPQPALAPPPVQVTPTAGSAQRASVSAAEQALVETLSGYNRAETEAAALLTIEPLLPFIDPTSPFAVRRAQHLAERRQQNAPHRTILVRWAIGTITVSGTTATVVTQETWSNQEAGAVGTEQATVRVTYTLRQDQATGRWLIVESSQMAL